MLGQNVAGYWLCKGPPGKPVDPAECDIVIYYLHGGGYVSGHAGSFLPGALRIAEIAAEREITLSFFGLEYSLAPETKFPAQVEEVVAGYKYLLDDQKIDASKIAVLGNSAGGHLALCLIASLHGYQLPKPGKGLFLKSPWIDLECSKRARYEDNKYTDYVSLSALVKSSKDLLGKATGKDAIEFVDFTQPLSGGISWKDVMPNRVWLSAGSHELLLHDIEEFSRCLEKDGVNAEFEVEPGGVHSWQGVKDAWDKPKYLKSTERPLAEGMMLGTAVIGNAILSVAGPTST